MKCTSPTTAGMRRQVGMAAGKRLGEQRRVQEGRRCGLYRRPLPPGGVQVSNNAEQVTRNLRLTSLDRDARPGMVSNCNVPHGQSPAGSLHGARACLPCTFPVCNHRWRSQCASLAVVMARPVAASPIRTAKGSVLRPSWPPDYRNEAALRSHE